MKTKYKHLQYIKDNALPASKLSICVLSPYKSNIDPTILLHQAKVFRKLGIPLEQVQIGDISHGEWMDTVAKSDGDDLIVFCDIDAFPITRSAFDDVIEKALAGNIVGMAQTANHLNEDHIYAGPMFLAFRRDVYVELGSPHISSDKKHDVGQHLTVRAEERGVPIHLLYPSTVIKPLWNLSDRGVFGIGTFYDQNGFFHLFQSRFSRNIKLFEAVATDVVNDTLDFKHYLKIMAEQKANAGGSIRNELSKLIRRS